MCVRVSGGGVVGELNTICLKSVGMTACRKAAWLRVSWNVPSCCFNEPQAKRPNEACSVYQNSPSA